MKFNSKTIEMAKKHAVECFPYESCGIVSDGEYIACENIHEDPLNHFEISQDTIRNYYINNKIEGIIHSHVDHPHLSKDDMEGQIRSGVSWGIVNVSYRNATMFCAWGDQYDDDPLEGRDYINGKNDCFGLVRSFYKKEKAVVLKDIPREYKWWRGKEKLVLDNFNKSGFSMIDESELRYGDVIIFTINANTPNHVGIYLGDGTVLHHLEKRKSKREPVEIWRSHIYGFARYNQ